MSLVLINGQYVLVPEDARIRIRLVIPQARMNMYAPNQPPLYGPPGMRIIVHPNGQNMAPHPFMAGPPPPFIRRF